MPHLDWTVLTIPGQPAKSAIVYLKQVIPPSLLMSVPMHILDCDLAVGGRDWDDEQPQTTLFCPQKHAELVRAQCRLLEFVKYIDRIEGAQEISISKMTDPSDCSEVEASLLHLNTIIVDNPSIRKDIESYQTDQFKRWNPAYKDVDRYIWLPICPREEVSTDQALLAMVNIFEEMGMIGKEPTVLLSMGPQFTRVGSLPKSVLNY